MPDLVAVKALERDAEAWLNYRKQLAPDIVPDLRNARLSDRVFTGHDFSQTSFIDANLDGSRFTACVFKRAYLQKCHAVGTVFEDCDFSGASLEGALFSNAVFLNCDLSGIGARGINLGGVNSSRSLEEVKSRPNKFVGASLVGRANLGDARLPASDFSRSKMEGARLTGANIETAVLIDSDLTGADLSGAKCAHADFTRAALVSANLASSDLSFAMLQQAVLCRVTATGINLGYANLSEADLRRAKLIDANLEHADLRLTDVHEAILEGARVKGCKITRQDMEDWQLQNFLGLGKRKLHSMRVIDGLAELQRYFGGFWSVVHGVSAALWLTPFVWICVRSLILSVTIRRFDAPWFTSVPLWGQLWGYVISGRTHPAVAPFEGGDPYPLDLVFVSTFALLFLYNVARLILVIDVKIQEHKGRVSGLHPLVEIGWFRSILLTAARIGVYLYVGVAASHIIRFLGQDFPTPVG